jgi:hypothetical protein
MDAEFEWDEEKATENFAKHGVTFATASQAFKDPFAVEWRDDRFDYGEERFNILGMVENRLLSVAYTVRAERARIISARRAEPNERRKYHEANG